MMAHHLCGLTLALGALQYVQRSGLPIIGISSLVTQQRQVNTLDDTSLAESSEAMVI